MMKKIQFILCLNIVFLLCLAGWVMGGPYNDPACQGHTFGRMCGPDGDDGPPYGAPNSGDGVSDGSGFDRPSGGPNGLGLGNGHGGPPVDHSGPAPNSGDGDPDGSGH